MNRRVCELEIEQKVAEIIDIYLRYNPSGEYLSIGWTGDHISVDNAWPTAWGKDEKLPINVCRRPRPMNEILDEIGEALNEELSDESKKL